MHVVMSDTQYKVSVVAKVTRKSFIRLVSCVVQLTACLIPFSLIYMNTELLRQVRSTVLLLCSLVSALGLTTVKQLSVGKQSSPNVVTLIYVEDICGMTKGPPRHKETWWWNEEVAEAVRNCRGW